MRPLVKILLGATFFLSTACGGDGGEAPSSCTDPVPAATVMLADFVFEPACIGAVTGDTIALENTGVAPHTFSVDDADIDMDLPAGTTGEASLVGVDAGSYPITCRYHPQMTGTLVVG